MRDLDLNHSHKIKSIASLFFMYFSKEKKNLQIVVVVVLIIYYCVSSPKQWLEPTASFILFMNPALHWVQLVSSSADLGLPCISGTVSHFRHGVILMTSTLEQLVQSWKDANDGCQNSWGCWLVITSSYMWFVHLISPCNDLRIAGFFGLFVCFNVINVSVKTGRSCLHFYPKSHRIPTTTFCFTRQSLGQLTPLWEAPRKRCPNNLGLRSINS